MQIQPDSSSVEIRLTLGFSPTDLDALVWCSTRHYDGKCQEANERGIINGIRNSLDEDGVHRWACSASDCDLLVKILEVGSYGTFGSKAPVVRICALSDELRTVFKLLGLLAPRYARAIDLAIQPNMPALS
jgi:hypothetical protein